jgi:hypothetical protein
LEVKEDSTQNFVANTITTTTITSFEDFRIDIRMEVAEEFADLIKVSLLA